MTATAGDELKRELYEYLVNHFYDQARTSDVASWVWVMNEEWLDEIRKIDAYEPPLPGAPLFLLGFPVVVSGAAGVPVLVSQT